MATRVQNVVTTIVIVMNTVDVNNRQCDFSNKDEENEIQNRIIEHVLQFLWWSFAILDQ